MEYSVVYFLLSTIFSDGKGSVLVGWLVGWMDGWLVGWSVAWLAWSAGRSVG